MLVRKLAIKKQFLVVLLLNILSLTLLLAQPGVDIKEHVAISPIQKPRLNTTSGGTFEIQFQYSGTLKNGPSSPTLQIRINESEPCSTRAYGSAP